MKNSYRTFLSLLLSTALPFLKANETHSPMIMEKIKIFDRLNDLIHSNEYPLDIKAASPLTLATLYIAYQEESKYIEQMLPFIPSDFSSKASENLKAYTQQLTDAYIQSIRSFFLGNVHALEKPDIIIILGTISPYVEERMEFAIPTLRQFSNIPIILSGGGRQLLPEASTMEEYLYKKGIKPDHLYKETDSLDTRGNAIFSKFLMREHDLMSCKNILLITSDYHGPRALDYFQCVFGPNYDIAVALSPSNFDLQELAKLVQAEMTWLIRFHKETFTLHRSSQGGEPLCQTLEGDEISIFYQMLTQDPFYQTRWDLARRYAHLISLKKTEN